MPDFAAIAAEARESGGPALRAMTFQDRGRMLKALGEAIADDRAAGVLLSYAGRARRELPAARLIIEGEAEPLAKGAAIVGQRVLVPRQGLAVHVGAERVVERLAPSLLAGMPAVIAGGEEPLIGTLIGAAPPGALQRFAGPVGGLMDALGGEDVVSFTGTPADAAALRGHPAITERGARFIADGDGVAVAVAGPDASELEAVNARAGAGGEWPSPGLHALEPYLRRIELRGASGAISKLIGRHLPGAPTTTGEEHPFRKRFGELELGYTLNTASREITLEDIEHFAHFTGDTFYAHMDEEAARASPIFGGRVAHGYLILAFAAGLFVDPDPGPVLANYGLDNLRFVKPMKPGDTMAVALTVKAKSLRSAQMGEVRWGVTVTNGAGEVTATYDLLTMNAV